MSFPLPADNHNKVLPFQYISRQAQNVLVRLHDDEDEDRSYRFRITLAPLEVWREVGVGPSKIEVFKLLIHIT